MLFSFTNTNPNDIWISFPAMYSWGGVRENSLHGICTAGDRLGAVED